MPDTLPPTDASAVTLSSWRTQQYFWLQANVEPLLKLAIAKTVAQGRQSYLDKAGSMETEAVGIGRVPSLTARVFRTLDKARILGHIRIVGTNALYAYEALAGVHFAAEALATGDVDLLLDARRALRIMVLDPDQRTVLGILRRLDHSFKRLEHKPYTVANAEGFMVDLIRPQSSPPWRRQPGERPLAEDDLVPSAIEGLQWLVNSTAVEALVVDDRGYPAPIVVPDPRIWMLHKAWLSERSDRDAARRRRDAGQARAALHLLQSHLLQFPLTDGFINSLARPLREAFGRLREQMPTAPKRDDDDDAPQPDW
jgi:hypothetical protein